MKTSCRINLILLLFSAAPARASSWETGISGSYSIASRTLTTSDAFNVSNAQNRFVDFSGRIGHRLGPGILSAVFGLYSSFGLRETVTDNSTQTTNFLAAKSAETGLPVSFDTGSYRVALGWNALQLRYRYYLADLIFVEAGSGAAYGFGAIEASYKGFTSAGSVSSLYYHRYAEWGFINSASIGVQLPFGETVHFEAACEVAWLWAQIREPNIFLSGDFTLSQTFFRPMVGVALKF